MHAKQESMQGTNSCTHTIGCYIVTIEQIAFSEVTLSLLILIQSSGRFCRIPLFVSLGLTQVTLNFVGWGPARLVIRGGKWAQKRREPLLGRLQWARGTPVPGRTLREAQGLRPPPVLPRSSARLTPGDLGRARL